MGRDLGFDANALIEQARLYLIGGIHFAMWLAIVIAILAMYLSFGLPNIKSSERKISDTLAESSEDFL